MIVIGFFCLLFSGCSPTADPQYTLTPSPEITPAAAPQNTQSSVLETPAAEAIEQGKERYFTLSYRVSGSPVKNLLEDRFSYSPTTIDIIISNDDKYIGFIYEYGIDITFSLLTLLQLCQFFLLQFFDSSLTSRFLFFL